MTEQQPDTPTPATAPDPMDDRRAKRRAAYVSGLRRLADLLEARPDVPVPNDGGVRSPLSCYSISADNVAALAAELGRPVKAEIKPVETRMTVWLTWAIDGVGIQIAANADIVCQAQTTGVYQVGDQTHNITRWALPAHLDPNPPATTRTAGPAQRTEPDPAVHTKKKEEER